MKRYYAYLFVFAILLILNTNGFNYEDVRGWFEAGDNTKFILKKMKEEPNMGVKAVVEIGIFQGKSFICMLEELPPKVPIVALDLFDDLQIFNYDHAGLGNISAFQTNLKSFFYEFPEKREQVVIKAADSTKLHKKDIMDLTNNTKVSVFSIDGCHTVYCTLHDMRLAFSVLDDHGIIILDDYFNKKWPGVSLAVGIFLHEHHQALSGFAYGFNKFYIVRRHYAKFWQDAFIAHYEKEGIPWKMYEGSGVEKDDILYLVNVDKD